MARHPTQLRRPLDEALCRPTSSLTLLGAACAPAPEDLAETPSDFIPMSYLVKRSQAQFTGSAVGPWLGECFGQNLWGAWGSDGWRKDNQQFYLWDLDDAAFKVTYGPISWSPTNSQWSYGKTEILKTVTEEVTGSAILLDNTAGDDVLNFSRDAEIDRAQSRSTTTDKEVSVDIGVKSTASIGGDNVGAKFEQEVSATLGIKTDVAKAEEESKGSSEIISIAEDVDPRRATLITIDAPTITSQTPFTMSAAWVPAWVELEAKPGLARPPYDCPKQLGWSQAGDTDCYTDGACAKHKLRLAWDDFLSLIGGYNTDFPHFKPGPSAARAHIENPDNRWVSMSGIQHRTYQNAATYTTGDVTGQDLNAVADAHGVDNSNYVTGGG